MKRRIALFSIFLASAVIVLGAVTGNGLAFSNGSISLDGINWSASFIPSDDDTGGDNLDYFCVVCYNADGTLNDIDIRNKPTSNEPTTASGPCDSTWGPAVMPLSVVLLDPHTRPTGVSEETSSAAPYCGVAWNPPGQEPTDNDSDNDGIADANDNCPNVANPGQADFDGDGIGNACDPDDDNDGVNDGQDQCANTPSGVDVGADGCPISAPGDVDGDGVADANDNCPNVPNPGQADSDGNGIGNACDTRAGGNSNNNGGNQAPVAAAVPGCDITIAVPQSAVGGTFVKTTEAYFGPDTTMATGVVLEVGKTAKVIGMDASASFYKIVWNCSYLWVPVGTLGPTFDDVWNGAPLPINEVQ